MYKVVVEYIVNSFISHCDAAERWQINVQDPATPTMEGMMFFHDYLIFFLILIGIFVFWILYKVLVQYDTDKNQVTNIFTHSSNLEIGWTISPAFLLGFIAIPSFTLLYSTEELIDPLMTLKIIGHQWYWSYEYSDYLYQKPNSGIVGNSLDFDSYMISTADLVKGGFRLLEVDNRVILPINTPIRVLVTSADVLHCWAIPSFGFKIDACPGRLSQGALYIKRPGVFYGQCSEICGVNHGFMPVTLRSVNFQLFNTWLLKKLGN